MTEAIQAEIGRRAQSATNNDELVAAIFESFVEHEVDPNEVSLEDMKHAVVVAVQSVRELNGVSAAACLA